MVGPVSDDQKGRARRARDALVAFSMALPRKKTPIPAHTGPAREKSQNEAPPSKSLLGRRSRERAAHFERPVVTTRAFAKMSLAFDEFGRPFIIIKVRPPSSDARRRSPARAISRSATAPPRSEMRECAHQPTRDRADRRLTPPPLATNRSKATRAGSAAWRRRRRTSRRPSPWRARSAPPWAPRCAIATAQNQRRLPPKARAPARVRVLVDARIGNLPPSRRRLSTSALTDAPPPFPPPSLAPPPGHG